MASRSAQAVGIDDWGTNVDANDIQALFARATTQPLTALPVLDDPRFGANQRECNRAAVHQVAIGGGRHPVERSGVFRVAC